MKLIKIILGLIIAAFCISACSDKMVCPTYAKEHNDEKEENVLFI